MDHLPKIVLMKCSICWNMSFWEDSPIWNHQTNHSHPCLVSKLQYHWNLFFFPNLFVRFQQFLPILGMFLLGWNHEEKAPLPWPPGVRKPPPARNRRQAPSNCRSSCRINSISWWSNQGFSGVSPGNGGYDRKIRVWTKRFRATSKEYVQKSSNKSKKSPLGCNGDHQNGSLFLPDCYWIPLHSALLKIPQACIHMMSNSKTFNTKRSKMLLSPWLVDASCNPFENLTNYLPFGDFLQCTRQTCDIQL